MKSLKEYFANIWEKYGFEGSLKYEGLYNDMMEFYDNKIPSNILNRFLNGEYIDYISENLKTHDINLLIKKLCDEFPKGIKEIINYEGSFVIIFNDKYKHIRFDEKFQNILKFYNYTLGQPYKDGYIIEPIYSKNMDEFVYNDCNEILYHFTDCKSAEYIIKNGLKIKGSQLGWNIPKRIYLWGFPGYINSANKDDIKKLTELCVNEIVAKRYGICCLKVDLNKIHKYSPSFYKDTLGPDDGCVFTLNNIPSQCITTCNIGNKLLK